MPTRKSVYNLLTTSLEVGPHARVCTAEGYELMQESSVFGWALESNLEIDDPEQRSKSATLAKRARWKD